MILVKSTSISDAANQMSVRPSQDCCVTLRSTPTSHGIPRQTSIEFLFALRAFINGWRCEFPLHPQLHHVSCYSIILLDSPRKYLVSLSTCLFKQQHQLIGVYRQAYTGWAKLSDTTLHFCL